MKSQIFKSVVLIALFAGRLSISAQNNRTSSAFAIDKNITSFEVVDLVDNTASSTFDIRLYDVLGNPVHKKTQALWNTFRGLEFLS